METSSTKDRKGYDGNVSIEVYEGGYRVNEDPTIHFGVGMLANAVIGSMESDLTYSIDFNESNSGRMGKIGTTLLASIAEKHNALVNVNRSQTA